jgi:hypothetical protein
MADPGTACRRANRATPIGPRRQQGTVQSVRTRERLRGPQDAYMLREEAADCGQVILAAEDAHRAGRGQVRSQRQRDDCRRGRIAAIQRRGGRACRGTRAGRPEERDIPSDEARHGSTLVAGALRASVGSTEVTVCPHTWTLTTPCARASRRYAEPKNFPIGIAHPWSWAIGSSTSAAQRSFDGVVSRR